MNNKRFVWTIVLMSFMAMDLAHASSRNEQRMEDSATEMLASSEQMERKGRSEAVLRAEGVPINEFLPAIEAEDEVTARRVEEIAHRALALLVVALKGEGLEQSLVEKIIKEYALSVHFSPMERAFITNPAPTKQDRIQFSWRYEAAWTLLWALGYVEKLGKPSTICDVPRAVTFMHERSAKQFISEAKPRSTTEILDESDRIYRYHWAVVDARLNGRTPPAGLEPGVTQERHHALNWLIGYMDQDWDDISTDT